MKIRTRSATLNLLGACAVLGFVTTGHSQLLLSDDFNAPDASSVNANLGTRQGGSLAPLTYAQTFAGTVPDPNSNFIFENTMNFTVGNNGAGYFNASNSLNQNFTASNAYTIGYNTNMGAALSFVTFGSANQNELFYGGGGNRAGIILYATTVQLYIGGAAVVTDTYAGGPATVLISVANSGAWNGTGTATIGLSVNGNTIDLNGGAAGTDYTTTGFSGNFITLGADSATGLGNDNTFVNFDNLAITAVPEPSTFALAAAGLLVLTAFRRRRQA